MASMKSALSAPSVAVGSQTPLIQHAPEFVSSAGDEAIGCAALAGLHLDPWEQLVLRQSLGERADGKWAAFEVGVEAPRQNGKGSILEARELAGLFVFGERLIVHSAHEQLTATKHFERLLGLIQDVPEFERRMLKPVRGKGSEAIKLKSGQEILFKTRTAAGGRGLTGDLVVLDEAMILMSSTMGALVPLMAARSMVGNPQMWYAGSAVDQQDHEHGLVFANVKRRAIAREAGLAYFGWAADIRGWLERHGREFDEQRAELEQITPAMLMDEELRAQANPGLGIRISPEHVSREMAAMGAREFARERLGLTDLPSDDAEDARVIAEDVWKDLGDTDSQIEGRKVFAVDMSPDRTWAAIAVAGKREDGLQHIEIVEHKRGSGWLLRRIGDTDEWSGRLYELHQKWPDSWFAIDARGPAAGLIQPMKDAGLEVVELSTQDYGQACGGFYDACDQDRVRHIEQDDLDEAVASARTAPLGEAWKWSRRHSTGADISPLIAVTLARWGDETLTEASSEPLIAWR